MNCVNPGYVADGFCDDETNNENCFFDGGDCCMPNPDISYCSACQCLPIKSKFGDRRAKLVKRSEESEGIAFPIMLL